MAALSAAGCACGVGDDADPESSPTGHRTKVCGDVLVVDVEHRPVAASLTGLEDANMLSPRPPVPYETAVETGAGDGRAQLCIPDDARVWVDVRTEDGLWARELFWAGTLSETFQIQVGVPPVLRGRVVDGHGHPVAGARIELGRPTGIPGGIMFAGGGWRDWIAHVPVTAADGVFEAPLASTDPAVVFASRGEDTSSRVGPLELRPGEVTEVELVLMETLSGVVLADGELVSGADVRLSLGDGEERSMATGDEGRFSFEGLSPDATPTITVSPNGRSPQVFEGLDVDGEHRLEVDQGQTLEVRLEAGPVLGACLTEGNARVTVHVRDERRAHIASGSSRGGAPIVIESLPLGEVSLEVISRAWSRAEVNTTLVAGRPNVVRVPLEVPGHGEQMWAVLIGTTPELEAGSDLTLDFLHEDGVRFTYSFVERARCAPLRPGHWQVTAREPYDLGDFALDIEAATVHRVRFPVTR